MRPLSEIRLDLEAALIDGGGTTRQLAQRTGWAIGMTREALNNMARAGVASKCYVRVAGVCRPVPFYSRAVAPLDDGEGLAPMLSLIAAWARPVGLHTGVAM